MTAHQGTGPRGEGTSIDQMRNELYVHLDLHEQGLVERALIEAKAAGRADAVARIEALVEVVLDEIGAQGECQDCAVDDESGVCYAHMVVADAALADPPEQVKKAERYRAAHEGAAGG